MKVLIPSDNRDYVAELAAGYSQMGWQVATGAFNFDARAAQFDLIHFQWPEELTGWQPPREQRLKAIADNLEWWHGRCPSIVTAHNFYPHGYERNAAYKRLYEVFYQNCNCIHNYSECSRELILNEYSGVQPDSHVVTE